MKTIFQHHLIGSKLGTIIVEKIYPGIVACAVIPQTRGWNGWLIKSGYMAKNEL
jgi:hypothetical protein